MPQIDSIKVMTDTIDSVRTDSLAQINAKLLADSLHTADSIAHQMSVRFVGIPHPSLPQSENWTFAVIFFLFLLLVLSVTRSFNWVTESVRTFFQVKERSSIFSKATVNDIQTRLLLIVFAGCVFSLYAYTIFFQAPQGFVFVYYLRFLAVTFGFIFFKYLSFKVISYVFLDMNFSKMAQESYFNVLSFLGVVLYPILLFRVYSAEWLHPTISILFMIAFALAAILILIKLFQIFFHKIATFFYLLLYLCTLEILPLIVLFSVYKMLV